MLVIRQRFARQLSIPILNRYNSGARSRVLVEVLRVIPVSEYTGEENNEHSHGPYQTIFKFKGTAPDTVVQRGYLLPFQAAWEGDYEL